MEAARAASSAANTDAERSSTANNAAESATTTAQQLAAWVNEGTKRNFDGPALYLPGDLDDRASKAVATAPLADDDYMAASFVSAQEEAPKPPKKRRRVGRDAAALRAADEARATRAAAAQTEARQAAAAQYDPFVAAFHSSTEEAEPEAPPADHPLLEGRLHRARRACKLFDVGCGVRESMLWPRETATDLAEATWDALPVAERCKNVLTYLRCRHFYCLDCNFQYEDDVHMRQYCEHACFNAHS